MKRIFLTLLPVILAGFIPFSAASGQEKKNEQKIKIVVNDGEGDKTVIDTVFNGDKVPETITLKDGKVIVIDNPEKDIKAEKIFVTVSSDGNGEKKEERKVIIFDSDSANVSYTPSKGKTYSYAYSSNGKPGSAVVTKSAGEKSVSVYVNDGESGADDDMTRFIIAKDGMVVTIEGRDAAKAKELAKEIENKLGVKESNSAKGEVKSTPKKSTDR